MLELGFSEDRRYFTYLTNSPSKTRCFNDFWQRRRSQYGPYQRIYPKRVSRNSNFHRKGVVKQVNRPLSARAATG